MSEKNKNKTKGGKANQSRWARLSAMVVPSHTVLIPLLSFTSVGLLRVETKTRTIWESMGKPTLTNWWKPRKARKQRTRKERKQGDTDLPPFPSLSLSLSYPALYAIAYACLPSPLFMFGIPMSLCFSSLLLPFLSFCSPLLPLFSRTTMQQCVSCVWESLHKRSRTKTKENKNIEPWQSEQTNNDVTKTNNKRNEGSISI